MAYFIPSYIQKRLLQYALARLELLDSDALDLDNLDIALGKRSTVELRDIGLRLPKLTSLLHLSQRLRLIKAKILHLRVTVPADIYRSGIVVEVDGVIAQIQVLEQPSEDISREPRTKKEAPPNKPRQPGRRLKSPPLRESRTRRASPFSDSDSDNDDYIPTTQDLAKSFLDVEPREEREELEAAINTQSQRLSESSSSTVGSLAEQDVGTGTELSVPGFLASFLKGVRDRLEIRIRDVEFRLDLVFPGQDKMEDSPAEPTPASISLRAKQLSIEGVTADVVENISESSPSSSGGPSATPQSRAGKRRIQLDHVCAYLITELPLFERAAKSSRSLSVTSRPDKTRRLRGGDDFAAGSLSMRSSPTSSTKRQSFHSSSPVSERSHGAESAGETLAASVITADDDRFADPADDDDPKTPIASSPTASKTPSTQSLSESASESAAGEPHMEESQMSDMWKSYANDDRPGFPYSIGASGMTEPQLHNGDEQIYQSSSSFPDMPDFMNTSDLISFEGTGNASLHDSSDGLQSSPPSLEANYILDATPSQIHLKRDAPPEPRLSPASSNSNSDGGGNGNATPLGEGMSESKIYSHEEAESMYMSAMAAESTHSAQRLHLPGAWDSHSDSGNECLPNPASVAENTAIGRGSTLSNASDHERCETPRPREPTAEKQSRSVYPSVEPQDREVDPQDEVRVTGDPSIGGDIPPTSPRETDNMAAKQFLMVKEISLWVPKPEDSHSPTDSTGGNTGAKDQSNHQTSGTFSEYAETGTSRRRRSSMIHRSSDAPPAEMPSEQNRKDEYEVSVGDVELLGDVATAQLLLETVSLLLSTMRADSSSLEPKRDKTVPTATSQFRLSLSVSNISLSLVDYLQAVSNSTLLQNSTRSRSLEQDNSSDVLFKLHWQGLRSHLEISPQSTTIEAGISLFSLGYPGEDILSFDDSARLRTSVRDLREPQLDAVSLSFSNVGGTTVIKIGTLPININFDLPKLDDALVSFGGLSGILELSNSIMSNSTILADSPLPKRARGVHFESPPPAQEPKSMRATKLNIRLGGALVTIRGRSSYVTFQSSAIKVLFRLQHGLVGLSVDEIRLAGPYLTNEDENAPAFIQLANTRVEFLFTPQDDDLERLLSILTPSRDKYENDDDILIDTLLRQRRKGSVIRLGIDKAQVEIQNLEKLEVLTKLGDELAKLSTVTKYLPEDDRPGILTLCAIEELHTKVTINDMFGTLTVNTQGSQIAHVGLPSLLAIEVGTVVAQRGHEEQLIHPVHDLSPSERLPMIMARFLGGEIEPIAKLKFFNVCLEYRVPTILAILGLKDGATSDDVLADVAASVATITAASPKKLSPQSTRSSDLFGHSPGPLHLDVLFRDCALGLNPRNMSSKVLLVLTDTKLLSNLPGKENLKSVIDVRKASILMIDQEEIHGLPNERLSKRPGSAGLGSRQVTELCKGGYVSISYISAARADIRLLDNSDGSQTVDVELRDDLFVLETCADSTQTLFETLNALKPPMPPNRDTKYRTEVMPMEEMMASFTGDVFIPSRNPAGGSEEPLGLDEGDLLDDEELPANLEYVGSFYNPDPQPTDEEFGDSILNEQDIEQVASSRPARELGSQPLLESFQEQYEVGSSDSPLSFEDNYFGTGSEVQGHARKWDSVRNQPGTTNEFKIRGSPLKVRARDVHIIWNLFDGYDWQSTRDIITKTVKEVEHRAEERRSRRRRSANVEEEDEESVIGDFLFNSIYIGVPANRDPKDLTRQINRNVDDMITETESLATGTTTVTAISRSPSRGHSTFNRTKRLKVHRSKQHKITFELKSVSLDMIVFPPGSGETQSSVDIKVKEFEIFDHVPTSTWKKFATYLHDAGEREMGKPMIRIEMLTVKPVAELAASELVLKVNVLPLRLHVDQDALDFITRFFEFKAPSDNKVAPAKEDEIFLQRVEVNTVRVKLDYKPKKVDYAGLRSGHTGEFMNFFILDGADFYLRHVIVYGILGFDKLHKTLNDIWQPDVRGNQLPGVLAGLAPVRGIVNVGSGVRDLVVVPMREYRKDGRVVRSIQKGAVAFAKTTTSELARLGAKLAIGTHTALQGAENMLSPAQASHADAWDDAHLSSDDEDAPKGKKNISAYADAPINISSAIRSAAQSLERDLLTARDAIIAIPGEVADAEGLTGGARAVVRRAPTVLLRPAMGLAGAVGKVGLGVGNWVDPEGRRREEREGKWKRH
ncbi:MAG: hypothetical protein Q9165_002922 [Trypethelium subeluteriae]